MARVLAIESDTRQAAILKRVVKDKVHAELVLVDSRDAAIAAINASIPDVILVTALLSPRDEEELIAHLRKVDGADHLQLHTIPQLASGRDDGDGGGGLFGKLKKKKDAPIPGCDPELFADEIRTFLDAAESAKAVAAANGPRRKLYDSPNTQRHAPGGNFSDFASDSQAQDATASGPALDDGVIGGSGDSAWASPFEWRPSSAAKPSGPPQPPPLVTNKPLAVVADERIEQAEREEQERKRKEAERAEQERQRQEAEARAAEERRRQEAEARAADEERKRREAAARAEEEARRKRDEEERARKEAAARAAAEEERKRKEAAARAEEEARRKREEEERKRKEAALRAAEDERKRKEAEARALEAERKRKEAEARAEEEARKRREAEARAAEEERKRREAAARAAEEERQRREAAARAEEERKRKEAEARAAEAERRRKEAEARAAEEERKRKEAAARAEEEARKRREAEARAAEEERKRLEALARAEEERKRREALARAEEEARRKREEEERKRKEAAARAEEEARQKREAERLRLEIEAAAAAQRAAEERQRQEAREAERRRLEAEAAAARQRAEAAATRKREDDDKLARKGPRGPKAAPPPGGQPTLVAASPRVVPSEFAEFSEEHEKLQAGILGLDCLDAWARRDRRPAAMEAERVENNDLHDIFARLTIPAPVASVGYPGGCRIRRVRVPADPSAKATGKKGQPVILSRRALDDVRSSGR